MPNAQIKRLSIQYGKSVEEVDDVWNHIKKGLLKSIPESDPKFYPVLLASLKKKMENKENEKDNSDKIHSQRIGRKNPIS